MYFNGPTNYTTKIDKPVAQDLSSAKASGIKAEWSLKVTLFLLIFFSYTTIHIHTLNISIRILFALRKKAKNEVRIEVVFKFGGKVKET